MTEIFCYILIILIILILSKTIENYNIKPYYGLEGFEGLKGYEGYEGFEGTKLQTSNEDYGSTYYKSPELMTEEQKKKFVNVSKFSNMTIGDYINYLNLSEKIGSQRFSIYDKTMLAKYKSGLRLTLNDIPTDPTSVKDPPLNAQNYFESITKEI